LNQKKERKNMKIISIKQIIWLFVMFSIAGLTHAADLTTRTDDTRNLPDLPCVELQVRPGHTVIFHAYAIGIQRYRWNGTSWVFVEPVARLFANSDYTGEVGIHYAGPTWESNSGSKVVAARVAGCPAGPTAIDWLLLEMRSTTGPGPCKVTHIQRVNTVGGKAPAAPGSAVGAVVDEPYTAEYFFYREN
jgi:hypothetical protein